MEGLMGKWIINVGFSIAWVDYLTGFSYFSHKLMGNLGT
jgi:hypothetical protein